MEKGENESWWEMKRIIKDIIKFENNERESESDPIETKKFDTMRKTTWIWNGEYKGYKQNSEGSKIYDSFARTDNVFWICKRKAIFNHFLYTPFDKWETPNQSFSEKNYEIGDIHNYSNTEKSWISEELSDTNDFSDTETSFDINRPSAILGPPDISQEFSESVKAELRKERFSIEAFIEEFPRLYLLIFMCIAETELDAQSGLTLFDEKNIMRIKVTIDHANNRKIQDTLLIPVQNYEEIANSLLDGFEDGFGESLKKYIAKVDKRFCFDESKEYKVLNTFMIE
jgi:hypothetical protein